MQFCKTLALLFLLFSVCSCDPVEADVRFFPVIHAENLIAYEDGSFSIDVVPQPDQQEYRFNRMGLEFQTENNSFNNYFVTVETNGILPSEPFTLRTEPISVPEGVLQMVRFFIELQDPTTTTVVSKYFEIPTDFNPVSAWKYFDEGFNESLDARFRPGAFYPTPAGMRFVDTENRVQHLVTTESPQLEVVRNVTIPGSDQQVLGVYLQGKAREYFFSNGTKRFYERTGNEFVSISDPCPGSGNSEIFYGLSDVGNGQSMYAVSEDRVLKYDLETNIWTILVENYPSGWNFTTRFTMVDGCLYQLRTNNAGRPFVQQLCVENADAQGVPYWADESISEIDFDYVSVVGGTKLAWIHRGKTGVPGYLFDVETLSWSTMDGIVDPRVQSDQVELELNWMEQDAWYFQEDFRYRGIWQYTFE